MLYMLCRTGFSLCLIQPESALSRGTSSPSTPLLAGSAASLDQPSATRSPSPIGTLLVPAGAVGFPVSWHPASALKRLSLALDMAHISEGEQSHAAQHSTHLLSWTSTMGWDLCNEAAMVCSSAIHVHRHLRCLELKLSTHSLPCCHVCPQSCNCTVSQQWRTAHCCSAWAASPPPCPPALTSSCSCPWPSQLAMVQPQCSRQCTRLRSGWQSPQRCA